MRKVIAGLGFALLGCLFFPTSATARPLEDVPEQRGCCSWHQGVCGCLGNTVKCCDGSLSDSAMTSERSRSRVRSSSR